ncbi:MAG TPA: prephenate dehydratase [Acidimicrobiales bacterium]|nr:prephenate dehydratase [Acidimicrobiales bacterium]HLI58012.1 prephenate dehydratase [Actinomycetota bacterium]
MPAASEEAITSEEPGISPDPPVAALIPVGYQGEAGAYSQRAVRRLFESATSVPFHSVHRVFEAVEIGTVAFGVVPLENSHAGSINESYDLLVRHGVQIVAETIVRISHSLLGLPGTTMEEVRTVYSHSQALDQCSEFLDSLQVERVAIHDTAGAARMVAEKGNRAAAAIASTEAAELYELEVLAADIEDRSDNSTKFVAIARSGVESFGPPEKTSVVFATADIPGALYRCLGAFAERHLNLSKLEHRPSRTKAFQSNFYVDFDAPLGDPRSQEALSEIAGYTSFLRVLGSYPKAR